MTLKIIIKKRKLTSNQWCTFSQRDNFSSESLILPVVNIFQKKSSFLFGEISVFNGNL